mmetsp:Transcript_27104/g.36205  ORF Transcript_27104/g.36205 Transcript_27104/m.36205 type:complete len:165 (-) Transcript_27104:395-889(-)
MYFAQNFLDFMNLCDSPSNYESQMVLDCANGVGAIPMQAVAYTVRNFVDITLVNTETKNPLILNEGCGAEFVHKEAKLPSGVDESSPKKAASFDGDADRLMYFKNLGAKPVIIDGDKQFSLLMLYVTKLLKDLGIENSVSNVLVNTAYANSQALSFIKRSGINT